MGIRISKLPETQTTNVKSDVIPIVQEGVTKKILLDFVKHPDLLSVYNNNKGLSANWNSVFSSFYNLSSDLLSGFNNSKGLSANWNSVFSSVYKLSSDWNSGNINAMYNKFLPISGGKITGDLEVNNYLTVVGNISSNQNIYASNGLEVGSGSSTTLYVDINKIGINTESPNVALTVVGSISSNQNISAPTISSDMLKIGNSLSVTGSLGSVVKKIEIFDSNGTSLGFIPVYNTIS